MSGLAPIAIFIFKRADHLRRTLQSLRQCSQFADSKVVVYGDGPQSTQQIPAIEAARAIAMELLGPQTEYNFRNENIGLARSVIAGVGDMVARFGRVIVIEDDLELSPTFLAYMNSALKLYEKQSEVFQISGHMFDAPEMARRGSAIFLPFTTTWGWGTWRRAWDRFDPSAAGWQLLQSDRDLRRRFNLGGHYDYAAMLERQMKGIGDSWGVRWYWSVFRHGGVACFPPQSLVQNIGMDGTGTHGKGALRAFRRQFELPGDVRIDFPCRVSVDQHDLDLVTESIWRQNGGLIGAAVDVGRRHMSRLWSFRKWRA